MRHEDRTRRRLAPRRDVAEQRTNRSRSASQSQQSRWDCTCRSALAGVEMETNRTSPSARCRPVPPVLTRQRVADAPPLASAAAVLVFACCRNVWVGAPRTTARFDVPPPPRSRRAPRGAARRPRSPERSPREGAEHGLMQARSRRRGEGEALQAARASSSSASSAVCLQQRDDQLDCQLRSARISPRYHAKRARGVCNSYAT